MSDSETVARCGRLGAGVLKLCQARALQRVLPQIHDEHLLLGVPDGGVGAGLFAMGNVVELKEASTGNLADALDGAEAVGPFGLGAAGLEGNALGFRVVHQQNMADGLLLEYFHSSGVKVEYALL